MFDSKIEQSFHVVIIFSKSVQNCFVNFMQHFVQQSANYMPQFWKLRILTLAHIFLPISKTQLYCRVPHLVMLGHIFHSWMWDLYWCIYNFMPSFFQDFLVCLLFEMFGLLYPTILIVVTVKWNWFDFIFPCQSSHCLQNPHHDHVEMQNRDISYFPQCILLCDEKWCNASWELLDSSLLQSQLDNMSN